MTSERGREGGRRRYLFPACYQGRHLFPACYQGRHLFPACYQSLVGGFITCVCVGRCASNHSPAGNGPIPSSGGTLSQDEDGGVPAP